MQSPLRALSPGSSLSSYDFFAYGHSRSSRRASESESDGSYGTVSDDGGSSDDEILLSFSDLSSADFRSQRADPRSPTVFSEDEFVLMSRPRSPASSDDLTTSFSALSMSAASTRSARPRPAHTRSQAQKQAQADDGSSPSSSPRRRNRKRRAAQAPGNASPESPAAQSVEPAGSPSAKPHSPSKVRRKARRAAARAAAASPTPSMMCASIGSAPAAGLGDRPIVDDVSEVGSECLYVPPELYKTAQRYVSSCVPFSLPFPVW